METNFSRSNLDYIDDLYRKFKENSEPIEIEWQRFFEGMEFATDASLGLSEKELDVYHLIVAYRDYGHFEADLNPLKRDSRRTDLLSLSRYNLKDTDLDKKFQIGRIIGLENAKLRDIIAHLKKCYCSTITCQVADAIPEIQNWFINEFEKVKFHLTNDEKKQIFQSITRTEALEKFLHSRFVGAKRFSVEGGDALLPMLEALVPRASFLKVEEIIIGMAHRGRVNVLANFLEKSLEFIFSEFDGSTKVDESIDNFDGDVKYHLGNACIKQTPFGACQVTLAFNPSHLETVNPVVIGMTRAAQRRHNDTQNRKKVIPVLIHGDAAFAGQGVVAETFQMSQVKGYTVGGTIHIVVDNQIGFTTDPINSRSSEYSSDLAKCLATPIIHVNGDEAESCIKAIDLAIRFRQQFGKDIVITVHCYRRHGHNEGDEPSYTQPVLYEKIKTHPTLREIYGRRLILENVIDEKYYNEFYKEKIDNLQAILDHTRKNPPIIEPIKFEGFWTGLRRGHHEDIYSQWNTKTDIEGLKRLAQFLGTVPDGFTPHPKLQKLLDYRKKIAQGFEKIDWGMGELLAYGSLIKEGNSVRLSGQDCIRGTFTHRHSGLYDYKNGSLYIALKHLGTDKELCVYDSVLSEYGVLGFEYGNAICDPTFLTIWEAQFGDFANGAQIVIDQFISSGESKWQQMCGLVLLLPHSYEGQGPEHSSARLERFLNLCAQDNIQVCNLTTPAQIFHALRRQIKRPYRKPLIIMSPKSLLRHPLAVSNLEELANGEFQEVIDDTITPEKVKRIVLCTGKLYYDLLEARNAFEKEKASPLEDVALIRLEQIYPFPDHKLTTIIKKYSNSSELVWAQEEPKNMGAWQHLFFKLSDLLKSLKSNLKLDGISRSERASPATGSHHTHKKEQKVLVEKCLGFGGQNEI